MSNSRCREWGMVYRNKTLSFLLLRELICLVKARCLGSSTEDWVAMGHSILRLTNCNIAHMWEEISRVFDCLRIELVELLPRSDWHVFGNRRINESESWILIHSWLPGMYYVLKLWEVLVDSLCVCSPALLLRFLRCNEVSECLLFR